MRTVRWLSPLVLVALALLVVALTAERAAATTVLRGGGHRMDVKLRLDDAGVPIRFDAEESWLRCPHSEAPMDDRRFSGLDLATVDRLRDSGRFSERSSGFRYEVRYRLDARRVGDNRWSGSYLSTARVFYRGYKIMACERKDARALWQVKEVDIFERPLVRPAAG